jgi:hypothetical protein
MCWGVGGLEGSGDVDDDGFRGRKKFTNKALGTDYEELTNMRQERREQRRRRGRLG